MFRLLFSGGIDMESDCSVLIVGGAILLVPGSVKPGDYDDVINSILFAQLVADKQVAKDSSVDWYDAYSQVLDNFWLRFVKTREDNHLGPESAVSAATLIVAAMAKMEDDLGRLTAEAISRLAKAPESHPAIDVLRRHMYKAGDASVERTTEAAEGAHVLVIVARTPDLLSSVYIRIQTRQALDRHSLATLGRGADLRGVITLRCAQANLSEDLYRLAREGVALKVKDRIAANVALLTVGDELCAVDPSREIQP
ncbi:hypothetical protein [Pseudomonas neuropathica]|uniref:hypothetical protein n=1 Tax=Pseudomonas neuropathica TaxID=2730425 RepID=UPI003EBD2E41